MHAGKTLFVCQSFEMLVSPGDNVLVESPTYSGALASVSKFSNNLIAIF